MVANMVTSDSDLRVLIRDFADERGLHPLTVGLMLRMAGLVDDPDEPGAVRRQALASILTEVERANRRMSAVASDDDDGWTRKIAGLF